MTVDATPPSPAHDADPAGNDYATLYRLLVAAEHERDHQLAMLAHELRNPLNALQTSAEVLHRAAPGSPEATSARDVIGRQVRKLAQLIDLRLPVKPWSPAGAAATPPDAGALDDTPHDTPQDRPADLP